jgi:hypothetical protein
MSIPEKATAIKEDGRIEKRLYSFKFELPSRIIAAQCNASLFAVSTASPKGRVSAIECGKQPGGCIGDKAFRGDARIQSVQTGIYS